MKPLTAAALSLLLGNAALLAQQTSNIAGLVRDSSGARRRDGNRHCHGDIDQRQTRGDYERAGRI